MKLVCVMPCRNEDWILGLTARAVLMWCDELVVLDHASTDNTPAIISDLQYEYPTRVYSLIETDPTWQEMRHRQSLLETARTMDATHIVMVDADEVLTGNLIDWASRGMQSALPKTVVQLPWIQLRGSINRMHNSGVWGSQFVSMAFQDSPECHWAVRNGYDFHHRHPMGRQCIPYKPLFHRDGGLMHLQMVSERRLRAKQCLYKMQEVVRWPGRVPVEEIDRMYSLTMYGEHPKALAANVPDWAPRNARRAGEAPIEATAAIEAFATVPGAWWAPYKHLLQYLHEDAEPWQEAESRRLMAEHGLMKFIGLDLFGVCG